MADEANDRRLSDLERRWQQEPGSRLFLQLAEEYRRTGQTEEALRVLDDGLERNPRHVAAQVAKGRCLLELGRTEEATDILQGVLGQDATHLVASKLLVEVHIQSGDALAARRRLDAYAALAAADPEIETLRERIQDLLLADAAEPARGEPEPAPVPVAAAPPEAYAPPPPAPEPAERRLSPPPPGEPFPGLEVAAEGRLPGGGEVFPLAPLPLPPLAAPSDQGGAGAALEVEPAAGFEGEGMPGAVEDDDTLPLGFAETRREAGAGEEAGAGAAEAEADGELPAAWGESASIEDEEVASRLREAALVEGDEGEAGDRDERAAEGPAPVAPSPGEAEAGAEPATVTLGQLYLRQGHTREAERIFRRVLERDPGNAAAREALRSLGAGSDAEGGPQPEEEALPAAAVAAGGGTGLAARKVELLERYLTLVRRGVERDVP